MQVDNITVTKKSFNLLFRGTEFIITGKLKDPNTNFDSILNAYSKDGNFNGSMIVRRLPVSITETRRMGNQLNVYSHFSQL